MNNEVKKEDQRHSHMSSFGIFPVEIQKIILRFAASEKDKNGGMLVPKVCKRWKEIFGDDDKKRFLKKYDESYEGCLLLVFTYMCWFIEKNVWQTFEFMVNVVWVSVEKPNENTSSSPMGYCITKQNGTLIGGVGISYDVESQIIENNFEGKLFRTYENPINRGINELVKSFTNILDGKNIWLLDNMRFFSLGKKAEETSTNKRDVNTIKMSKMVKNARECRDALYERLKPYGRVHNLW